MKNLQKDTRRLDRMVHHVIFHNIHAFLQKEVWKNRIRFFRITPYLLGGLLQLGLFQLADQPIVPNKIYSQSQSEDTTANFPEFNRVVFYVVLTSLTGGGLKLIRKKTYQDAWITKMKRFKKQIIFINKDNRNLWEQKLKLQRENVYLLKSTENDAATDLADYFSMEQNNFFSLLSGKALQEFLGQLEEYQLSYRSSLGFDSSDSFGVEVEYEGIDENTVSNYFQKQLPNWQSTNDLSLHSGGEMISPISFDTPKFWEEYDLLCQYLKEEKANMACFAGGHIHIGVQILGRQLKSWRCFLKTIAVYEPILFRFGYGMFINGRTGISRYAAPTASILLKCMDEINQMTSLVQLIEPLQILSHWQAVNFTRISSLEKQIIEENTIEFRFFNATDEAIIGQNNINTVVKLARACAHNKINESFLDDKIRQLDPQDDRKNYYQEVYLEEALELCDLIFTQNMDKIYFLKQYIKGFEHDYGYNQAVPTKSLVK